MEQDEALSLVAWGAFVGVCIALAVIALIQEGCK